MRASVLVMMVGAAAVTTGLAVALPVPSAQQAMASPRAQQVSLPPPGQVVVATEQPGLSPADVKAIRTAVQAQLDAFADDDGDKAFGLSSVDTRTRFGSSENFLRVVKQFYPPIYRHRRVHFSAPELIEGDAIQLVNVIDAASHVWVAVYRLERDDTGIWKIDGCQLHETTGISI